MLEIPVVWAAVVSSVSLSLVIGLAVALAFQSRRAREERELFEETIEFEKKLAVAEVSRHLAATEATLEAERAASAQKLALLEEARQNLSREFEALATQALAKNHQAFLELAGEDLERREKSLEHLLAPVQDRFDALQRALREIEQQRVDAYSGLRANIEGLGQQQQLLRAETAKLSGALRSPQTRGRWGEIHLQRVVEIAGMIEHCDFSQQSTLNGTEGPLRPDLIVHLPGQRQIVVDAKLPLDAYLHSLEAAEEGEVTRARARHAECVKRQIKNLSEKSYWKSLPCTPELVVLFLPMESVLGVALEEEPGLIEEAARLGVVVATPSTLVTLLRTVHYAWGQEAVSRNAREIANLGLELEQRLGKFTAALESIGRGLRTAGEAYETAKRQFDRQLVPGAERLARLRGAGDGETESRPPIER